MDTQKAKGRPKKPLLTLKDLLPPLARACGASDWVAARSAIRSMLTIIPGHVGPATMIGVLEEGYQRADDNAKLAVAAGSFIAATQSTRLAIELRERLDELVNPKRERPPKDRRAFLDWQFGKLANESRRYEGRDGQAYVNIQRQMALNRVAVMALDESESTQAIVGSEDDQEAALVEAIGMWSVTRRRRFLGALDARFGRAQVDQ